MQFQHFWTYKIWIFNFFVQVIPLVHLIKRELEKPAPPGSGLQGLINDLLASHKKRFDDIEENKIFSSATLLDPRFKASAFHSNEKAESAKSALLLEAKGISHEYVSSKYSRPTVFNPIL